ncbi:hypothetical protein [Mycobacterium phage Maco6]|uniref:Uncharacterized protein n=1 Tax=Mycobacterium phage Maco2 TaxID=2805749 RepID=A0A899IN85_9CAUD|nr:hypothetical protein [Mycobacterium phage Maco2]QXN76695.1 hypothetical protein [Mycobacterium phage Maco7]UNY41937.1 hypothetical protein [Mycobacterium phage Maco6]WKV22174.1 neck protein [Mycobacteroides phage 8UZL]
MSKRMKINGRRLEALRKGPGITAVLRKYGERQTKAANQDFWATAPGNERYRQRNSSKSKEPYDMTVKQGGDRTRVFVQTASYPARRQEKRSSSLLRSIIQIKSGGG